MKEYLDSEGVCFGIDCLRSFSEIQKLTKSSVTACDQFLQVVGARVKAEEEHAMTLSKIAAMPLEYSPGSLQDCMAQLQSDTRHKADQHQVLAESLVQEVKRPITLLREQMSKREKSLTRQYNSMYAELKRLEDKYTKCSTIYDKAYKAAVSAVEDCRKSNVSTEDYIAITSAYEKESQKASLKSPSTPLSHIASWNSLSNLTSSTNLQATKEKGKDLLNWVVASASGTPTTSSSGSIINKPEVNRNELCLQAMRSISKLEESRISTRKSWVDYVVMSQRYAIKTQILLTKLQGMQESFILILQDHLRKIVVIESSFLANQQYDIQMLFKVMENIDVREDMRQFILKTAHGPIDLYESDGEEKDSDDRDRSMSNDVDDILDVDGTSSKVILKNEQTDELIWSDRPWTNDIFSAFKSTSDLSHIRSLSYPPCSHKITFHDLINSETSSKNVSSYCLQYLDVESVRRVCKLSLVSRHMDKHDSLIGNSGSLIHLEALTIKNRGVVKGEVFEQNGNPSSGSDISHPLNEPQIDSPLSTKPTPISGPAENEDDEPSQGLMTYATAEEALEKMVALQSRMRCHWLDLIEEVKGSSNELNTEEKTNRRNASSSTEKVPSRSNVEEDEEKESTSPCNRSSSVDNLEAYEASSSMLHRSLKDAERDKEDNIDSAKCREIMNTFGLLDAVTIDAEEHAGTRSKTLSADGGFSFGISTGNDESGTSANLLELDSSFLTPNACDSSVIDDKTSAEQSAFSKKYMRNATPESLDFLTS